MSSASRAALLGSIVSGTVSSTAIALTIRAIATIDGLACDSGVVSIALDRHSDGSR